MLLSYMHVLPSLFSNFHLPCGERGVVGVVHSSFCATRLHTYNFCHLTFDPILQASSLVFLGTFSAEFRLWVIKECGIKVDGAGVEL